MQISLPPVSLFGRYESLRQFWIKNMDMPMGWWYRDKTILRVYYFTCFHLQMVNFHFFLSTWQISKCHGLTPLFQIYHYFNSNLPNHFGEAVVCKLVPILERTSNLIKNNVRAIEKLRNYKSLILIQTTHTSKNNFEGVGWGDEFWYKMNTRIKIAR